MQPVAAGPAFQIAVAAAIIVFRIAFYPVGHWFSDGMLIAAFYWLFLALGRWPRAFPAATASTMALLLVVYGRAQGPHLIHLLTSAEIPH
jgi:hypothetical protein